MANLDLSTVELTSTLRTAPLNGAPSSSDYNAGQRETLVDLSTLSDFINNQLLPLINALPASALLPDNAPVGMEGRTIWADTSDQSNLFFDSLASVPLSIADAMRVLNGMVSTMSQELVDIGVEVASLQARLASTNQNDIALALQNLSSALNQVSVNQQTQNVTITQIQGASIVVKRSSSTNVPSGTSVNVPITFDVAFDDDFYTATLGLEVPSGPQGLVYIGGFQRVATGAGMSIAVTNHDSSDHSVIVHVMAQKNTGA